MSSFLGGWFRYSVYRGSYDLAKAILRRAAFVFGLLGAGVLAFAPSAGRWSVSRWFSSSTTPPARTSARGPLLATSPPDLAARRTPPTEQAGIEVCFSPEQDCAAVLEQLLRQAGRGTPVRVQMFSFTFQRLAQDLVEAHKRGADVRVLLDGRQATEATVIVDFLRRGGVAVALDSAHAEAHNKVLILPGVVATGSFNWTASAERRNAENLLVFSGADTVQAAYAANWERHWNHARLLQ